VQFILGRAQSGKTSLCYTQLQEELARDSYDPLYLLVPEQFSLQAQMDLCKRFEPGLLRIEIITFTGLAKMLLKEAGQESVLIDDLERVMLLKKILETHQKELLFFKKAHRSQGFLDTINQLITIFDQNGVSGEILEKIKEGSQGEGVFKVKWQDIQNIYGWFNELLSEQFITAEKTLCAALGALEKSSVFKGRNIWVDGFYGFTTVQKDLLIGLAAQMERVIISLPSDRVYAASESISAAHPFYESIVAYQKIEEGLLERGLQREEPIFCDGEEAKASKVLELEYLERAYLEPYSKPYQQGNEAVRLATYATQIEEVEEVAKKIKDLVREEGYRYADIAMIVGDFNVYNPSIGRLFEEYEIPYFVDQKRKIIHHPLVRAIQAVFEVMVQNWSYKSVMELLRTQMLPFTLDEIDLLENYVLAYGIRGKKAWEKPFDREYTECAFNQLDEIRERLVAILEGVQSAISEGKDEKGRLTVKRLTQILHEFLEHIGAKEKVEVWADEWSERKNLLLEQENLQIWEEAMHVLERLVTILGEEKMTPVMYKNIVTASFGYVEMGLIPPSKDQVIIGTLERTRLPQTRAVFLLGANEGVMPKASEQGELLSDMDKLTLAKVCNEKVKEASRLADVFITQQLYGSKFLLYSSLTRAKERLYISCARGNEEGKGLRPAFFFYKLKNMFQCNEVEKDPILAHVYTPLPTLTHVGKAMKEALLRKEPLGEWEDVAAWYEENEKWSPALTHIKAMMVHSLEQPYLKPETTQKLYENTLETSVSQLELFRSCACCYFIKYGLKASERKLFKWNTKDIGSIFHATLEYYPKELEARGATWVNVEPNVQETCIKAAVKKAVEKYNTTENADGKLRYTVAKVEKMSKRAIHALTYQLSKGQFEPKEYEVSFGYVGMPAIEIEVEQGKKLLLRGQIDRIDVYEKEEGQNYIKILDYKSGKKDFDLLQVFYGLQLQLLLYLDAYLRLHKEYAEAGVFYFHIHKPYLDYQVGMSKEELDSKRRKQYKLSGLVLEDSEVITSIEEGAKGEIIPATIKKDGEVSKASSTATKEQFYLLREYIRDTIAHLGKDMLDGKIEAKPYKLKEESPCTYCTYHSICQVESLGENQGHENLPVLDKEEIWKQIHIKKGGNA
jgi:ATP-dependent helicase/nuclease subunit B